MSQLHDFAAERPEAQTQSRPSEYHRVVSDCLLHRWSFIWMQFLPHLKVGHCATCLALNKSTTFLHYLLHHDHAVCQVMTAILSGTLGDKLPLHIGSSPSQCVIDAQQRHSQPRRSANMQCMQWHWSEVLSPPLHALQRSSDDRACSRMHVGMVAMVNVISGV